MLMKEYIHQLHILCLRNQGIIDEKLRLTQRNQPTACQTEQNVVYHLTKHFLLVTVQSAERTANGCPWTKASRHQGGCTDMTHI